MRFFLLLTVFIISCRHQPQPHTEPVIKNIIAPTVNYDSAKDMIPLIKDRIRSKWLNISSNDRQTIFINAVVQTIVPAWIGTDWDFNGITQIPRRGSIACGYFVTTVLRDAGLPIARVKLAQCASEQMIRVLVQTKYIQRFSNSSIDEFLNAINISGDGLYLIGLDNHTGFVYSAGGKIWFIHSSLAGTRDVQMEDAANSTVLRSSRYKVIGKISADEKVLSRWINN